MTTSIIAERLERLIRRLPESHGPTTFHLARFDAGLEWTHYPSAAGVWAPILSTSHRSRSGSPSAPLGP